MRNLRTVAFEHITLSENLPLTATAWDANTDSIICAFGPTPTEPVIELKRKTKVDVPESNDEHVQTSTFTAITSWDAPCPLPHLQCDEIILMHHFSDTLTTCIVLAGGDLMLVREEPQDGQERIEIVGSVDIGIIAAAWAPDEELLALVTSTDSLVLMSRDLEPVTETSMTPEDLQVSRHVSVGWGKKETQFQGKRAKAMRDPTMPEQVDEGVSSPFEDGRTLISWRGDGAYLAVNSMIKNHRRAIRVYSREGALESISEPVDGLESALSWRPAGNLIASVKRSGSGDHATLEVVFFERNGLRHGQFQLRSKPPEADNLTRHINLAWNIDSTVLAVSFPGFVQYWTMSNYHYYLKQEVRISDQPGFNSVTVCWHAERPLKCSAANSHALIDLEFLYQAKLGSVIEPYDYGIAAVVDGDTLRLTPLKHAGVPPPMSFCEAKADSNMIDIAISGDGRRLFILTQHGIELWEWETLPTRAGTHGSGFRHTTDIRKLPLVLNESDSKTLAKLRFTQVVFRSNNEVFLLAPAQKHAKSCCLLVHLPDTSELSNDKKTERLSVTSIAVPSMAQNLLTDILYKTVWTQSAEITCPVQEPGMHASIILPRFHGGHPSTMVFPLDTREAPDSVNGVSISYHKVSLTTKGSLLADDRVIARDCTSFILTDMHLIYTTAQHLLKFVHLTEPDKMDIPGDTPEVDERCRSVERGAKIVTVIPSIYAVVLQMPRGNLETIYPRVLVLTGIRRCLHNLEYRTAFLACQSHQVDMNILHDYQPDTFMTNIKKFVDDLKKPSRVDEFLSKLKDEDVTQTLYKDTLKPSNGTERGPNHDAEVMADPAKTRQGKVNAICDGLISVFKPKPDKYLQCIITAHVCKRPPDLTAALTLVSSLRETSRDEADLAISHLCFLTDTNRLFDAALGLYDLELTLLVAQNAQRDPREYMPFLQNLQSLPPLRRHYEIDNHLRNYAKAITSLHALEAHDEVEKYAIKHTLYTHALDLYKHSSSHFNRITVLYAEYLSSQSQHSAAATLYESLNDYESAYTLYALAHQWRESLACATLIPLETDKLQSLALSLATTLTEENRDYRSAATIHIDYLSNPLAAARLLCKGSYFADATRILSLHNHAASIPTTITSGLGDKFSEILELVADCKSQLSAQVPRILELRVKKAEDPLAFYGGDPTSATAEVDIPDNVSLAATDASTLGGQSLFTRYGGGSQGSKFAGTVASNISHKTSRTKRREERKRARGKKGSVYEEEYLVSSVARLIDRINGTHDEVKRLVSGLLRRGMREQAARVEEVMVEIVAGCEKAKIEVWGAVDVAVAGHDGNGVDGLVHVVGSTRPSGADGVLWDSQAEAASALGVSRTAPVVKTWTGSALVLR